MDEHQLEQHALCSSADVALKPLLTKGDAEVELKLPFDRNHSVEFDIGRWWQPEHAAPLMYLTVVVIFPQATLFPLSFFGPRVRRLMNRGTPSIRW